MYQVFYVFRVSRLNAARFTEINKQAAAIYLKHEAMDSTIARIAAADARHGCGGLADVLTPGPDEELFLGIDSFEDADHFGQLMPVIDADPEIGHLFRAIQQIIDLRNVVRWETDGVA